MKDEYIILNKTVIQQRITHLKKKKLLSSEVKELKRLLSQSTPLIPEIEKAFEVGRKLTLDGFEEEDFQDYENYISNLKLDI